MDKQTGIFHQLQEGEQLPPGHIGFQVGEVLEVAGRPFRVQRINATSIVLRPDVGHGESPAKVLAAIIGSDPFIQGNRVKVKEFPFVILYFHQTNLVLQPVAVST
jgi:hypothetical protein